MDVIKKEKILNVMNKYIKIFFMMFCIMFAIPSIKYIISKGTILNFNQYFKFLLCDGNRIIQTLIYIAILLLMTIAYYYLVKKRDEIFKNKKQIFMYIAIIALIFLFVVPFTCSDIFYYLGIGRIDNSYGQNPYYTTIAEFVEQGNNKELLKTDTVLAQGYQNYWSEATVVYGPIWTLICNIIAGLSFGNIDLGILIFKLVNVLVHLLNCYLIYKITNRKLFVLLYGLNPFVLIEGIVNVHNDMFVVLFILLSLYFLLKKKNLLLSLVALSLATTIKYFPVIILPFILIYYFRKEKPLKRFGRCTQYGIIFIIMVAIPYLMYVRDFDVLAGLFIQQKKLAKSFYLIIREYVDNNMYQIIKIKDLQIALLSLFITIYIVTNIFLLNEKKITFKRLMEICQYFLIAFTFILITNFQPWYILWLFPCMMWQKAENIKLVIRNIIN